MQSAALGLTCKDALQVFSQNETLALQAQVNELKTLLAHHRPPITHAADKMRAPLCNLVRDTFDILHPPDSRLAPVTHEYGPDDPRGGRSIWSNCNYSLQDDGLEQNSLQAVIMQVLTYALEDTSTDYCQTQSHKAITAVEHALDGTRQASGWDIFSDQQLQEDIVFDTIYRHFCNMLVELDDWDNNAPKWF